MENCEKVERRWEEEEMENLRIINKRMREELGKQEENDDTDLDGPEKASLCELSMKCVKLKN